MHFLFLQLIACGAAGERFFISGSEAKTEKPTLESCTDGYTCTQSTVDATAGTAWIVQHPTQLTTFFAIQKSTVEKWTFADPAMTDTPDIQSVNFGGSGEPVHVIAFDTYVAVAALGDEGTVTLYQQDDLSQVGSVQASLGFHGVAYAANGYLYATNMGKFRVCWWKLADFPTDGRLAGDKEDNCVSTTGAPRHIVFSSDRAYVACQHSAKSGYKNFYEFEFASDGPLTIKSEHCLSTTATCGGGGDKPDQLSEVVINGNHVYVSSRIGNEVRAGHTNPMELKRNVIHVLPTADLTAGTALNFNDHGVPMRVKSMAVSPSGKSLVAAGQRAADGKNFKIARWEVASDGGISGESMVVRELQRSAPNLGPSFVGFIRSDGDPDAPLGGVGGGGNDGGGADSSSGGGRNDGGGVDSSSGLMWILIVAGTVIVIVVVGAFCFYSHKKKPPPPTPMVDFQPKRRQNVAGNHQPSTRRRPRE